MILCGSAFLSLWFAALSLPARNTRFIRSTKKRLDDLKYIEKLAREDHNMVGKDEVPLFIVDDKENGAEQKNKDAESKNR